MGEVYRARDAALGRDVAVKFLPAAFSEDADRLRRFKKHSPGRMGEAHSLCLIDRAISAEVGQSFQELSQRTQYQKTLLFPQPNLIKKKTCVDKTGSSWE
jgi:serine/threonine protein kinase